MSTILDKTWAAVDGDEILFESDSELEVRRWVWRQGYSRDDCEVIAIPKSHRSVFL